MPQPYTKIEKKIKRNLLSHDLLLLAFYENVSLSPEKNILTNLFRFEHSICIQRQKIIECVAQVAKFASWLNNPQD